MTPETVMHLGRQAVEVALLLSAPLLVAALVAVVGAIRAISIQPAESLREL